MKEVLSKMDQLVELLERQNKLALLSKEYLTLGEVALYMGVTKSHVEKLTSLNRLRYSKPGGKNAFVKKEWLLDYLSQNIIQTNDELSKQARDYMSRL